MYFLELRNEVLKMATWIVGLIIIACVYLAAKQVIKSHKSGGCIGCGEGGSKSCCSHCQHTTTINMKK